MHLFGGSIIRRASHEASEPRQLFSGCGHWYAGYTAALGPLWECLGDTVCTRNNIGSELALCAFINQSLQKNM